MRQKVRLTESQLHKVIKESVKKVLNEGIDLPQYKSDYHNFAKAFKGLTFTEVMEKVDELGLSYGKHNPSNSRDVLDIKFNTIEIPIKFVGYISTEFEPLQGY